MRNAIIRDLAVLILIVEVMIKAEGQHIYCLSLRYFLILIFASSTSIRPRSVNSEALNPKRFLVILSIIGYFIML